MIASHPDPPAPGKLQAHSGQPAWTNADIERAKEGAELDAQNPFVWNELGNAYKASGMFYEAVGAYRKAVRLDNTYSDAWRSLGEAYHGLRRDKEADQALRKADRLSKQKKK